MPINANHIAFIHIVAFSQLQTVVGNGQALLAAIIGAQHDFGVVAFAYQLNDRRGFSGSLGFFSLIGEVLRNTIPAPFV